VFFVSFEKWILMLYYSNRCILSSLKVYAYKEIAIAYNI